MGDKGEDLGDQALLDTRILRRCQSQVKYVYRIGHALAECRTSSTVVVLNC